MHAKKTMQTLLIITTSLLLLGFVLNRPGDIPKLWDMERLRSAHLPLVDKNIEVQPIAEELFYKIPERIAYKTYPLYLPGREPAGYYTWLLKQEPEIIFDASKIKTEEDWVPAGEIIYDMPQAFEPFIDSVVKEKELLRRLEFLTSVHVPVAKDGSIPFFSLVVRKKGTIEMGSFSCGNCHNKVMPDGSVLKGGQGNYPFDDAFGHSIVQGIKESKMSDSAASVTLSQAFRNLFGAPWIKNQSQAFIEKPDAKKATGILLATVGGVMHRHSSALGAPTAIPDLFNIKERKYLDRTGLIRQRDIGDMMRYAVLNQEMDFTNSYGGFKPDPRPDSAIIKGYTRFSDTQAYALSKYLYSLKPLPNPATASPEVIARGKVIFQDEYCYDCHTPPFYSNNKLTPASGFTPSPEDKGRLDIIDMGVGTDSSLALYSRRGTGYYKVPSLAGVWNRHALMHGGYVTTLEEMFDPAREKDDFMPSGFNPNADKPFAVKGHRYGLYLDAEEKKALLAFLRSL